MLKKLFSILCMVSFFPFVSAASYDSALSEKYIFLCQSICNDDYEDFQIYSSGVSFDDCEFYGTVLLNLAAAAPRDKRKNTQKFIKDLIKMKARPNKPYQVFVKKSECKSTESSFQMSGSAGYETMHTPLENAILGGNIAAVMALCQHGANVMQVSIHLTSWWQRWFVESEKLSKHAEVYLYASQNQKNAMGCTATDGELLEIVKTLEKYEKEVPTWEDLICPIQ